MPDKEALLSNFCTDLVSLKKHEAFPLHLLSSKCRGDWLSVRDLCLQIGVVADNLKADLFVTWLPDPMGQDSYVVVIFYDDESKWTMAAHYNRQRLLGGAATNEKSQRTGSAPVAG
jgi:hypothetical protein